jgi:hypothetical protein
MVARGWLSTARLIQPRSPLAQRLQAFCPLFAPDVPAIPVYDPHLALLGRGYSGTPFLDNPEYLGQIESSGTAFRCTMLTHGGNLWCWWISTKKNNFL